MPTASPPDTVTLVETPRDAFQGLSTFIPTPEKIRHIAALLDTGFKHIDLGSFVSPKAVPQMADSDAIFAAFAKRKDIERIAIVVNEKGAERALAVRGVDTLGFPFSLSDAFQRNNTGRSTDETWPVVTRIFQTAAARKKDFILYLSMAFGTRTPEPNGAEWSEEALLAFVQMLVTVIGVKHISLADTVAVAKPKQVAGAFRLLKKEYPGVLFSAHFHGKPRNWMRCVEAALDEGCRRFDCAAGGLGGCPFACDELVANIPSEKLAERLEKLGFSTGIDLARAKACAAAAKAIQAQYAR